MTQSPFRSTAGALDAVLCALTAEIFGSAIRALPCGQCDASAALGLRFLGLRPPAVAAAMLTLNNSGYFGEIFHAMRRVVLPQALRGIAAPLAWNSLELVKATATASLAAVPELLRSARVAQEQTYNPTRLMVAALTCFVLLRPFCRAVARLERRMLARDER